MRGDDVQTKRAKAVPGRNPKKEFAERGDPYRRDACPVIGINRYQDLAIQDLNNARADAEAVHAVLTDSEVVRFDRDNVVLLLDDGATERRMRSEIGTALPRRADENDTVCIDFAGHGAPVIDPRRRSQDGLEKYLVPAKRKSTICGPPPFAGSGSRSS